MYDFCCPIQRMKASEVAKIGKEQLIKEFSKNSTNLAQKTKQIKDFLNSLLLSSTDQKEKMQINQLINNYSGSESDLKSLQIIFDCIIQKNEKENQESNKQIKELMEKSDKKRFDERKYKKVSSEKRLFEKDYQRTLQRLSETESAYSSKCEECDELKDKLEKVKRKAKKLMNKRPTEVFENDKEEEEEMIKKLNSQIEDLKKQVLNNNQIKEEAQCLKNEIKEKDSEIDMLKEELQKASKKQQNKAKFVFTEEEFDLKNPFTGELCAKFEKFKDMNHFEPKQRAQLILNEASRYIANFESTNKALKENLIKAQEIAKRETNNHKYTKENLVLLLNKLQQLESNEEILSENGIIKDKEFIDFVTANVKTEVPVADVDVMIKKLTNSDMLACSLVSSMLLANAKQQEQQKRLISALNQKEAVLSNIKEAGIVPEKVVSEINSLKKKKNDYRKALIQCNEELKELKNFAEKCEIKNHQMKEELQQHQENIYQKNNDLTDTVNEKAKLEERIKCMENKIQLLENEKAEIEEQKEAVEEQKNAIKEELKRAESEIANKKEEYAKLDVVLRMAKSEVKKKFCEEEEKQRNKEKDTKRKLQQLQSRHEQEIKEAENRTKMIKESSFRALDASLSQTSDLKGLLRDVLMKLETAKNKNSKLESENETLHKQVSSLRKKLSDTKIKNAKELESYKYLMQNKELNDSTNSFISNKETSAVALREKQRIMNIVARELGSPYNIEFFDADEEESFILFIRKIKSDLKKIKVFQNSQID